MRGIGATAICGVAASFVLACSLTSLDGFSGGGAGSAPIDGGAMDSPSDATTDGGGDGAGDAAVAPFCETLSPKATFCDDFERVDLDGAWGTKDVVGGATLDLRPSARSAGRELVAFVPYAPSGPVLRAELSRTFGMATEARVAFSYETDGPPMTSAIQTMALTVATPANGNLFKIYVMTRTSGITVVEQSFPAGGGAGGIFEEHALGPPIVFARRQRIAVSAKLSAPSRLVVEVDGATAYSAPADAALVPGTVTAAIGVHYADRPSGALTARIDDVAVYVK